MSLSIGSLGGVAGASYISTTPQNFSVRNQSQVSQAYQESMAVGTAEGAGIGSPHPVQYPTAQMTESNKLSHLQAAQETERAYEAIAAGFMGMTTSYGQDLNGFGYGGIGGNIDVYV